MRKYAADNLLVLREFYPAIYQLIRNRDYDKSRIIRGEARNGDAVLFLHNNSAAPLAMYSQYNPRIEADRWAQSVQVQVAEAKDMLVCGFGLGYHLEALLSLYPDKRVYVFEPSIDVFLAALESRDLRSVLQHKQVAIFGIGEDHSFQQGFLEEVFNNSTEHLSTLILPIYKTAFPDFVSEYRKNITQVVTAYVSSLRTLSYFREDWARNLILNMGVNLNTPSFLGMKGKCFGIPAVIVGSGPSLALEIDTLRSLRNKVVVIAAGSSIQALKKNGIDPHLVVSMDPGGGNWAAFESVDLTDQALLYIPTIHHSLLHKPCKQRMVAYFNLDIPTNYMMGLTSQDPIFISTATVSGTAIQAALYMGCKDIYLIGQDYGFPGDKFYADGVEHHSEQFKEELMNTQSEWVTSVSGELIRTNKTMTNLRNGIEQLLEGFPECSFYNASPIGADIKNTTFKPLKDILDQSMENEDNWFQEILSANLHPHTSEKKIEILHRLADVYHKTVFFIHQFKLLKEHLTSLGNSPARDSVQQANWLKRFEEIWAPIINDEAFKHVHGFFLQRQLNYLDRHWSEMLEEQDLHRRAEILRGLFEPLLEEWTTIAPLLVSHMEQLNRHTPYLEQSAPIIG